MRRYTRMILIALLVLAIFSVGFVAGGIAGVEMAEARFTEEVNALGALQRKLSASSETAFPRDEEFYRAFESQHHLSPAKRTDDELQYYSGLGATHLIHVTRSENGLVLSRHRKGGYPTPD